MGHVYCCLIFSVSFSLVLAGPYPYTLKLCFSTVQHANWVHPCSQEDDQSAIPMFTYLDHDRLQHIWGNRFSKNTSNTVRYYLSQFDPSSANSPYLVHLANLTNANRHLKLLIFMPQMWFIEYQYLCVFDIKLSFLLFYYANTVTCRVRKHIWENWFYAQVVRWQWKTWFCIGVVFWNFYYSSVVRFVLFFYFNCCLFSFVSPSLICRWRLVLF